MRKGPHEEENLSVLAGNREKVGLGKSREKQRIFGAGAVWRGERGRKVGEGAVGKQDM